MREIVAAAHVLEARPSLIFECDRVVFTLKVILQNFFLV